MDELTNEQIFEALLCCLGAYVGADKGCEECPLYEDHYCVDTLYSLIRERMGNHEDQARNGTSI